MAGIPQNFAAISNVLPTYNFVDIAAGTGIINFYAGKTVDLNLLSNSTYYSSAIYTQSGNYSMDLVNIAEMLDVDFDVLLNRPINVAGKVVVNIPLCYVCDTAPTTIISNITITVFKWDGVSETSLASNTDTWTAAYTGTTLYKMLAIDLNIPLTHFKIGEYLRLNIDIHGYYTAGGVRFVQVRLGHDPMNRTSDGTLTWDTSAAVPSRITFQVPVRLNL